MSVLHKYLSGAGALTLQSVVQRLLGALTAIVLARGLGVNGYGLYTAAISTASSAYGLVRLGIDASLHVYTARARQTPDSDVLTGQLLGAGFIILTSAGFVAAVSTAIGA